MHHIGLCTGTDCTRSVTLYSYRPPCDGTEMLLADYSSSLRLLTLQAELI